MSNGPFTEEGFLPLPSIEDLRKLKDAVEAPRPRAIPDNTPRRKRRPRASSADREWVPHALKHWRRVHGLSGEQAARRIGFQGATTWASWERGRTVPSYETLLRILAMTGLGHWTDDEHRALHDPTIVTALPVREPHAIRRTLMAGEDEDRPS